MTAVDFAVTDGVASLQLNGPGGNPIDPTFVREFDRALTECRADANVRAVVISGRGSNFCAGGDLRYFSAAGERLGETVGQLAAELHRCLQDLATLDVPVIAGVQGSVAGAGLSLITAADLVIAGRSAKFVLAYTRVGLSPDGGASWVLPRLVGLRRALELALLNRMLSADEAYQWGLVNSVVDDGQLESELFGLAQQLAAGPTRALGSARRLMRAGLEVGYGEHLAAEAREISVNGSRHDGQEGVRAFVERRDPSFRGT